MMPNVHESSFDGKGESFSNYIQDVELCHRVTDLEPVKGASALILNMGPVARGVCMAAGSDKIADPDGVMKIT